MKHQEYLAPFIEVTVRRSWRSSFNMAWKDKDRSVGKTEVPNRPRNVDIRSAAQRDRYEGPFSNAIVK